MSDWPYAGDSFGPFFFNLHPNATSCNVLPDPDISGIGVVTSFVFSALITSIASVCATILDGMLKNKHHILPEWATLRLPTPRTSKRIERCQLWRDVLEKLILGFADQQLVTGFALLIAGYIKLYQRDEGQWCFQNAHFYMVIYLACLSSGTHLACILTLRKYLSEHRTTGTVRIVFIVLFALLLTGTIIRVLVYPTAYWSEASIRWPTSVDFLVSALICAAIVYVYWITIMQSIAPKGTQARENVVNILCWPFRCFSRGPNRRDYTPAISHQSKPKRTLHRIRDFLLFSNGSMVFLTQMLCSAVSLAFVLVQKFTKAPASWGGLEYYTSLDNAEENEWGFGQIVALVLVTLPFVSALELYLEEKDETLEREGDFEGKDGVEITTRGL